MELSIYMREFADRLAPSDEIISKARHTIRRIEDMLLHARGIPVARVVSLVSYAKKTAHGHDMDISLLVFFNNEMPPFSRAMNEMAKELKRLDRNVRVGSNAFKLKVDGIDFDVFPAVNLVNKYISKNGSVAQNQIANVYHYLNHKAGPHVDKKRDFRTSLSESAVEFDQRHSPFSHAMSRLAKYWATKMVTQDKPKGKSFIMEYLGARAAEDEESAGSQDVLGAFRRFLDMVLNIQTISVYWNYFYSTEHIPAKIMAERPLLLDPCNPNDNLLNGVSHAYYNDLTRFAGETLVQLEEAQVNGIIPAMFLEVGADKIVWPKSL